MLRLSSVVGGLLILSVASGCSTQSATPKVSVAPAAQKLQPSPEGQKYRLAEEPAGAQDVAVVRADAAGGDDVVVVGRIGGDVNPWIQGRSAFMIVDTSIEACSDIPGDDCPTPWDYCCRTDKLKTGSLLVKVVDESGQLVASGAQELLGLGELDTVVVQGTLDKSEDGAAVLLANAVFVRSVGDAPPAEGGHAHGEHDHDHEHGDHDHHDDAEPVHRDEKSDS